MPTLNQLRGLKATDRTQEEQKAINQQMGYQEQELEVPVIATLQRQKPEATIPPDTMSTAILQNAMRYTITDGTPAFPLNNKVVQIAGKTGTAEVGSLDHWHSWMACYAPFNAPVEEQVVVVVLVEAVNEWEWWAPYATNIIFQGIFANQNYEEAVEALPATVKSVIKDKKRARGRAE